MSNNNGSAFSNLCKRMICWSDNDDCCWLYGDVYISHISDVRLDYKLSDQDSYKHLSKHYTRCTGPIKIEERKGNKKSQLSLTEKGTVHGPRVNLQVQAISLIFVGSLDM